MSVKANCIQIENFHKTSLYIYIPEEVKGF